MGRPTDDLSGKRFDKWTVLNRDQTYQCNEYNAYWLCRCRCGLEKPVNGSHLRLGRSVSCRRCSEHKSKGKICSRMWSRIKGRAKHGIEVNLGQDKDAKEFLYDLLVKQKFVCALSGLPIRIANTISLDMQGETTASVDRIDSTKGYLRDNVQWAHKWINLMKSDFTQDEFIAYCESVVRHKGAI